MYGSLSCVRLHFLVSNFNQGPILSQGILKKWPLTRRAKDVAQRGIEVWPARPHLTGKMNTKIELRKRSAAINLKQPYGALLKYCMLIQAFLPTKHASRSYMDPANLNRDYKG